MSAHQGALSFFPEEVMVLRSIGMGHDGGVMANRTERLQTDSAVQ